MKVKERRGKSDFEYHCRVGTVEGIQEVFVRENASKYPLVIAKEKEACITDIVIPHVRLLPRSAMMIQGPARIERVTGV